MEHRRKNSAQSWSLLDLFFPDWRVARDRRRKAVMVLFCLTIAALLLSFVSERFGWDFTGLLALIEPS